jgi:hypothetical protein
MPFPKGYRNTQTGKGRPPGVLNKATADIKLLAREHGPAAVQRLAELAGFIPNVPPAKLEATQIAAIHELLDRGYGRSAQAISLEGDGAVLGLIMIPGKSADMALHVAPSPSAVETPPLIEGRVEVEDGRTRGCEDGEVEATD